MERNIIYNEDCIAGMSRIPDNSVDMILTDLPYGITGCRWDSLIPFDALWSQFLRVAKQNAAIVLTAAQPFTTQLIASQPKLFRYCWYWRKKCDDWIRFCEKAASALYRGDLRVLPSGADVQSAGHPVS